MQVPVEAPKLKNAVSEYLSLMERISVGLNTYVYDLDIYARICRSKTINAWRQLEPIVLERRKSNCNPSLYKEFEYAVNDLQDWKIEPKEQSRDYNWLKNLKKEKIKKRHKCFV